jgi:hypothetical protein
VGGAPLRYLLEFFSQKPTIDTLHQAVASGDDESIHMIFGAELTRLLHRGRELDPRGRAAPNALNSAEVRDRA